MSLHDILTNMQMQYLLNTMWHNTTFANFHKIIFIFFGVYRKPLIGINRILHHHSVIMQRTVSTHVSGAINRWGCWLDGTMMSDGRSSSSHAYVTHPPYRSSAHPISRCPLSPDPVHPFLRSHFVPSSPSLNFLHPFQAFPSPVPSFILGTRRSSESDHAECRGVV